MLLLCLVAIMACFFVGMGVRNSYVCIDLYAMCSIIDMNVMDQVTEINVTGLLPYYIAIQCELFENLSGKISQLQCVN